MFDLIEALGFLGYGLKGWYFIFSRKYRESLYERWEEQRPMVVAGEVIGGIIGVGFSAIVVLLLFWYFLF